MQAALANTCEAHKGGTAVGERAKAAKARPAQRPTKGGKGYQEKVSLGGDIG